MGESGGCHPFRSNTATYRAEFETEATRLDVAEMQTRWETLHLREQHAAAKLTGMTDRSDDPLDERPSVSLGLTIEEIERGTRNVRIEMNFDDPINVRRQAEIIIGAMTDIKVITQEHHLGVFRQLIGSRRVADHARRQLARFNGKPPSVQRPPGRRARP